MSPRKSRVVPALWISLLLATPAVAEDALGDLKVAWKDGLRFTTGDGRTELRIGVRVQNDWSFFRANDELIADFGDPEDAVEFRRLYVEFDGVLEEFTELRAHVDVTSGKTAMRDVWVGVRKLPAVGTIRAGHQYEPMGLDEQTSDRFLMFAERALPMALVPSRNTGILATNVTGPLTWAAMVSRDTDDAGNGKGTGDYNGTARLAIAPWRSEDGRRLLHVAISGSRRGPAGDVLRYSQRPENHLHSTLVDTGELEVDFANVGGLELATVLGPLTVQAEGVGSAVDSKDQRDPTFDGWYAAASWFLTGEVRPYSRSSATFGRVKPIDSFTTDGGTGAWEIAARFSRLDLSDSGVAGGELEDVTLGLSWYANPYFRTTANWVHADVEESGRSDALILRFEANF